MGIPVGGRARAAIRYSSIHIDCRPRNQPMRARIRRVFLPLLALFAGAVDAGEPVRVFAAASLTNALDDIGAMWEKAGHAKPTLVYGASSALAKQIQAGAPADVFASADLAWMDYVDTHGKLEAGTRGNLLGNTLVMIVPRGKTFAVKMQQGFDLAGAFSGKLCTGEPGVVPVGIYAREALQHLGWWDALQGRIVGTDDVRTALAFVERAECPLGIVYATDARISHKVDVLAGFPEDSHKPIVYPFAALKDARGEARDFLRFVRSSPQAVAIFEKYGFTVLRP
jgi:molybdate transport system substrate-binding protein